MGTGIDGGVIGVTRIGSRCCQRPGPEPASRGAAVSRGENPVSLLTLTSGLPVKTSGWRAFGNVSTQPLGRDVPRARVSLEVEPFLFDACQVGASPEEREASDLPLPSRFRAISRRQTAQTRFQSGNPSSMCIQAPPSCPSLSAPVVLALNCANDRIDLRPDNTLHQLGRTLAAVGHSARRTDGTLGRRIGGCWICEVGDEAAVRVDFGRTRHRRASLGLLSRDLAEGLGPSS